MSNSENRFSEMYEEILQWEAEEENATTRSSYSNLKTFSPEKSDPFSPAAESQPTARPKAADQTPKGGELWQDILGREVHFRDGGDFFFQDSRLVLGDFIELCTALDAELPGLDQANRLRLIYSLTYDLVVNSDRELASFAKGTDLYHDIFDACMYTGLCMFIQSTTRIKAGSMDLYTYKNSPRKYDTEGIINDQGLNVHNKYFFDIKYPGGQPDNRSMLTKEHDSMRQYKHRLFATRDFPVKSKEWEGMPAASEHEWLLYFDYVHSQGSADPVLRDALKRIGNLYNDIRKAYSTPLDAGFGDRVDAAFKRFQSKVEKIKYENYLTLCKSFLEHIGQNQVYYGINLYRFEKEMGLYRVTNDVNRLLGCKDEAGEAAVLDTSVALNGLCYPHICEAAVERHGQIRTSAFVSNFLYLRDRVIRISRLFLDKCIEDGQLGEDWDSLLLNTINGMTEQVLYDPASIDYTILPDSQDAFEKVLLTPVYHICWRWIEVWQKRNSFKDLDDDD